MNRLSFPNKSPVIVLNHGANNSILNFAVMQIDANFVTGPESFRCHQTQQPAKRRSRETRLFWFPRSTLSKRFVSLDSGKRTQTTSYIVRNHGSESFVAEETAESDALNLASRVKIQFPAKTRFGEADHV